MNTFTQRPTSLDLNLYAGDGFAIRFEFKDQETGEPWPLDGDWKAEIRSGEVLTEFLIDDSEAAEGVLALSLSGVQTEMLQDRYSLTWDLEQSVGPRTWYRGSVHVESDVTA